MKEAILYYGVTETGGKNRKEDGNYSVSYDDGQILTNDGIFKLVREIENTYITKNNWVGPMVVVKNVIYLKQNNVRQNFLGRSHETV